MAQVTPVILCGDYGTRLWSLSRSGFPKQFLVLSEDDASHNLFQEVVERINSTARNQIQLGVLLLALKHVEEVLQPW